MRIRVQRLNLDAASFRQLRDKHDGDGDAVRAEVLDIVRTRGKMQNPVTGSGGMLVGMVEEVGPDSPLGLAVGDQVATPRLAVADPAAHRATGWPAGTAAREQVPCDGHRDPVRPLDRGRAARTTCPRALAMAVMDVCGAPALTDPGRQRVRRPRPVARRSR